MRGLVLQQVAEYFASKGRYMSYEEYKGQTDTPVSAAVLKRAIGGSWKRAEARIEKYFPELAAKIASGPVVEPVVEPPAAAIKAVGKK
jgi:hypothetical protein